MEQPISSIEWQANRKIKILLIKIFGSLHYFSDFLISPCLVKQSNFITEFLNIEINVIVVGANIIHPAHINKNI